MNSSRPAMFVALGGAVLSVLAFPPFGPGLLIIPGLALFLVALRLVDTTRQGFWIGAFYGLAFFGGLIYWLAELELIALILVPVEAIFYAMFGWWLVKFNNQSPGRWLTLAVGGWAITELLRYHFPVGGFEWGAAGYALSDNLATRIPAISIGTTGLTVGVILISGLITLAVLRQWQRHLVWGIAVVFLLMASAVPWMISAGSDALETRVAIVQGSTPCPFEHCPPNERLRTFEQHLALTQTLEPEEVDLVIWAEGSTGSTNADPVTNPEIGQEISDQARRIGAKFIVGGDRVVSDTEWINANVYFEADGEIAGEYRKQHPVPFGEYVPWRPVFEWIPALDRVPRDMIRGDGPVLFGDIGSVISFEGGFSRYALEVRRAGANAILVNTNEGSYGEAPTSDQFIGMTRMRAVELGVPVIHAAVTGKSTLIDSVGSVEHTTGLGTIEIFAGAYGASHSTLYTQTGDLVIYLAAIIGLLAWSRIPLVGSDDRSIGEE